MNLSNGTRVFTLASTYYAICFGFGVIDPVANGFRDLHLFRRDLLDGMIPRHESDNADFRGPVGARLRTLAHRAAPRTATRTGVDELT